MLRLRRGLFSWGLSIFVFSFDSVPPTQTSETSLRSQQGIVLWFLAAAVQ